MDVFELRNRLIEDYAGYVGSFIRIKDERIDGHVKGEVGQGLFWPEPLIQLNPNFERGETIEELVDSKVLHEECRRVFRVGKDEGGEGKLLRLHKHQAEAVKTAGKGKNYVLTTGTGSGKSLSYIIPIVNHVLRVGSGRGIKAIVVYPMNALANSQAGELGKFLCAGYADGKGPVTFKRYTGQEDEEERKAIVANPPDILLTNYVMLELMLTRPYEKDLINAAQNLQFLVLDELHTYRGRQGADVAMLVRRTRNRLNAEEMRCIGTSATMASGSGTYAEQQAEVARVASLLFGATVETENVIGETLRRATPERDVGDKAYVSELKSRIEDDTKEPPHDYGAFTEDPLASWIESTFGIKEEAESQRMRRAEPRALRGDKGAAKALAELTSVEVGKCETAIREMLMGGYRVSNPETGFPVFAFRLHQFIGKGDTVYASLESSAERHITVQNQQFVPDGTRSRILLPLVFCRECGQEFYCVRKSLDKEMAMRVFEQRELSDRLRDDESEAGYLFTLTDKPWPTESEEIMDRLPVDWIEEHRGQRRVKRSQRGNVPQLLRVKPDGSEGEGGMELHYVPALFRFCPHCGVVYGARSSDFAKLATLSSEGRSTATTILGLSAIRQLRKTDGLEEKARKLLSFTDNRQDASLQAGHFNDFVEVGLLRSALYRAVKDAGEDGLTHDVLAQKVFEAINLEPRYYASEPEARFQAKKQTDQAFKNILGYRLYHDLRRGWRIVSPNLEQCGLLEIEYASLDELCASEDDWKDLHPVLAGAKPEEREKVCKALLDYVRRELAIKVEYLDYERQEQIRQQSNQRLIPPWGIEDEERMEFAGRVFPRAQGQDRADDVFMGPRGIFAQYLRRASTFGGPRINTDDTSRMIPELLKVLQVAGIVEEVVPGEGENLPGYQLSAGALVWKAGDGTRAAIDPIRVPNVPEEGGRTNPFFVEFYKTIAGDAQGIEAREHTAQVPNEERIKREDDFREARLPILFCSPTMELGVDISQLNAVNMRNVPPTPANYAQRSGRAGRSGQPALVFSYCTIGSPHDQYFFKRPELMVAGAVAAPRLELANEDLVRAHLQAVWLAEGGQDLGRTLNEEILDAGGDEPSLELREKFQDLLGDVKVRDRAKARTGEILGTIEDELKQSDWYHETWAEEVFNKVPQQFKGACDRWRNLYRSAHAQYVRQGKIAIDHTRDANARKQATRLRNEAQAQIDLLTQAQSVVQSDFYTYRYFASEGFLPGYNFPRLPLSAFVPGRRTKKEFLSRPRFLAISEFGPRSIVYHEGSKYIINKVIMPMQDDQDTLALGRMKQCGSCGYIHPVREGDGPDLCEYCKAPLESTLRDLFRLENVGTRRREKINSDEEERLRLGFEIISGVRFAEYKEKMSFKTAEIMAGEERIGKLTYGDAATLWRVNLGWRRRANRNQFGFILDIERGYWAKNEAVGDEDKDDPMSARIKRVVPYVEDRRNALLLEFAGKQSETVMASLQAALKNAIQVRFQLEESELTAEPLPSMNERNVLLFYESSEGGAGVLRNLVKERAALNAVVKEALDLCHFEPETGEDRKRATGAKEDCEAGCYDCLMSYGNQRDHALLDRKAIKDLLVQLRDAKVETSPGQKPRGEHLRELMNLSGSDLERKWLKFVDERNLRLPAMAQKRVSECRTVPDFLYADSKTAIYVDGPPHDYADRQKRDEEQTECMEDRGYVVLRFRHDEEWQGIIDKYPNVFGKSV